MSNMAYHPDDLQLLRYVDGELPAREARAVRQHLETCWQCRTELEELERTIGECVRYRNQVLRPNLPSPPAPWMDIYSAISRADGTTGRESFLEGGFVAAMLHSLRKPWLIPVTVAAAIMGILMFEWRDTPSVQAAQLLHKAVAAAEGRPSKPRRIRIQTSSRKLIRTVGVKGSAAREDDFLAAMFRSAHYDWDDPLSARAFEAWRGQLPEKSDEVATDPSGYTIRTVTASSELRSASLKLRSSDLQPIEGRLEFRNKETSSLETVEIAELPAEPSLAESSPIITPVPPAIAGSAPVTELSPAPASGAAGELQVLAALHDVGADLGDPVEVTRAPSGIVVSGIGVPAERQKQIRDALSQIPHVDVRFKEPAVAADAPDVAPSSVPPTSTEGTRFQAQVERYLGGRAQFERFSGQLLEASEAAMSRAYALRRLAQRFPAGSEASLDPASRATLLRMCREHAAELARAEANIAALAGPILTSLGGSANAVQIRGTDSRAWQPVTEDLFRSAQRVERLLATMLDGTPAAAPAADLPSNLLNAIAQVRATAQSYLQLLSLEPGDVR